MKQTTPRQKKHNFNSLTSFAIRYNKFKPAPDKNNFIFESLPWETSFITQNVSKFSWLHSFHEAMESDNTGRAWKRTATSSPLPPVWGLHTGRWSLILPAKLSQWMLQTELQQEGFYFLVGVVLGRKLHLITLSKSDLHINKVCSSIWHFISWLP